ncbi:MAG: pantothenate kinase [Oscillospiraceae bacterium]|jgi:type II pantothenate kinase|nr:pantothenate kinase [Oscillospiraceae bacterium]
MSVILGIDIGGSTTKIVGLRSDGGAIAMHRVQAQDPITSLYGAMGNFLHTNLLQLGDVSRIALTGVGASYVDEDIYGIPTEKVEEFTAVGTGGLALSGQELAVVVSMGTGTAFIRAERGRPVQHLCGSGVGGGSLAGLCSRLCGTRKYAQIMKLAAEGDVTRVDLTVGDLTRNSHPSLPLDITAANFGNVSDDATPGDFAAGVVNMVLQSIGTTAVMSCRACGCGTAVLTGFMSNLPQARACFDLFTRLHGIRFIIPENAAYATSIGAALSIMEAQ